MPAFVMLACTTPATLRRHLLLVKGVDQRTVLALMGWTEMSMAKRYQHVIPELRREAADRIGTALWGLEDPQASVVPPEGWRADVGQSTAVRHRGQLRPELRP
jgi:hypothetical protein